MLRTIHRNRKKMVSDKIRSIRTKARKIFPSDIKRTEGAVEIITHWLVRPPLQELTLTRTHSFLKPLEIWMHFQIWWVPLLKVQRMVWLGLPFWWEVGTNFPYHKSWWMNAEMFYVVSVCPVYNLDLHKVRAMVFYEHAQSVTLNTCCQLIRILGKAEHEINII